MNWLTIKDKDLLVFSSNQSPPKEPREEWGHDIYYSWLDTRTRGEQFNPKPLTMNALAQEPVSVAINSTDYLLVTSEDSQYHTDELDQSFGIYQADLTPIVPYGQTVIETSGGHSGHVAASDEDFLITFCEGWIEEGGVDNFGTGDDIYSRIIHPDGTMGELIETQVNDDSRDWWPIAAGSDTEWLQVWQQYGDDDLYGGSVWGAITTKDSKVVKNLKLWIKQSTIIMMCNFLKQLIAM